MGGGLEVALDVRPDRRRSRGTARLPGGPARADAGRRRHAAPAAANPARAWPASSCCSAARSTRRGAPARPRQPRRRSRRGARGVARARLAARLPPGPSGAVDQARARPTIERRHSTASERRSSSCFAATMPAKAWPPSSRSARRVHASLSGGRLGGAERYGAAIPFSQARSPSRSRQVSAARHCSVASSRRWNGISVLTPLELEAVERLAPSAPSRPRGSRPRSTTFASSES